jgi:DNA-binding IclR family transcriptional regulator
MSSAPNRYAVPALERGLKLLQLFDRERIELSAPEIVRELELPRATVFRLIQTLESMGFLERHGANVRLGPAVLRLGFEYLASLELTEIARPVVERLRDASGLSVQVMIRDAGEAVVVQRLAGPSVFDSAVSVGTRFPAYGTVFGRMLLADLPEEQLRALFPVPRLKSFSPHTPKSPAQLLTLLREDRARGYAISEAHFERSISAIAAPARDASGRVVAAIGVVLQRPAFEGKAVRERCVELVLRAAADVSHRLNYRPEKVAA